MHRHTSMIAAFHRRRAPIAKAEHLPEELKGTSQSAEHLCTQYQRKVSTESAEGKINRPIRSPAFVQQTSCLHVLGCIIVSSVAAVMASRMCEVEVLPALGRTIRGVVQRRPSLLRSSTSRARSPKASRRVGSSRPKIRLLKLARAGQSVRRCVVVSGSPSHSGQVGASWSPIRCL